MFDYLDIFEFENVRCLKFPNFSVTAMMPCFDLSMWTSRQGASNNFRWCWWL